MNSGGPAGRGCALLSGVGKEDSLQEEAGAQGGRGGQGAGGDGVERMGSLAPCGCRPATGCPQVLAERQP